MHGIAISSEILATALNQLISKVKEQHDPAALFYDFKLVQKEMPTFMEELSKNNDKLIFSKQVTIDLGYIYNTYRTLAITTKNIHEIQDAKKTLRSILISNLRALSYSSTNAEELIIHFEGDEEEILSLEGRNVFIDVLQHVFF